MLRAGSWGGASGANARGRRVGKGAPKAPPSQNTDKNVFFKLNRDINTAYLSRSSHHAWGALVGLKNAWGALVGIKNAWGALVGP